MENVQDEMMINIKKILPVKKKSLPKIRLLLHLLYMLQLNNTFSCVTDLIYFN